MIFISNMQVEEAVLEYIQKAEVGVDELRRACSYISKSFYSLAGDQMQSQLSQLVDKESIVHLLVEEMGVEPLIALIELLSVESQHSEDTLACIQTLRQHHQNMVEKLSHCIECTSPVTTPTRPQVLIGSLFGTVAKVSPSPSPPAAAGSPVTPQLNILPSEILRFYSESCSEFDIDFS